MTITEARARELLNAAHEAWNKRDFESLLALYVDDLTYWSNFGGPGGGPNVVEGKPGLLDHLTRYGAMDCLSVAEDFRIEDGAGHATSAFFMRHPETGLMHSAVYRQVVHYRDDKILRLEEYHDASAFAAFVSLVADEEN